MTIRGQSPIRKTVNGTPVKNQFSTTRGPRYLRWAIFAAVALLLALIVAGCGGGVEPLDPRAFAMLGEDMARIERMTTEEQNAFYEELRAIFDDKEGNSVNERARARLLQGYIVEYQATTLQGTGPQAPTYAGANALYDEAARLRSVYGLQAGYRSGVLGALGLLGENSVKTAKSRLGALQNNRDFQVWVRQAEPSEKSPAIIGPVAIAGNGVEANTTANAVVAADADAAVAGPVLQQHNMAATVLLQADNIYKTGGGLDETYYKGVHAIVTFLTDITQNKSVAVVLALFLLAVIVKVVTAPLTTMAYRGMRDMQRIQPMLKELQEKYKDDRAKLAEEQMKLMKEHKVSPAGGCLPMLIQFPIFIAVYQAVRVYSYQFSDTGFLWISNLAQPNPILLILYAISMIVTQKLTATPAADPQQQALQNQMTYMMPIFLVLVLSQIASAFVLYWFFLNVLSAAHQYYLIRKFKAEETAKEAAAAAAIPPPSPAPEPPARRRKKGNR